MNDTLLPAASVTSAAVPMTSLELDGTAVGVCLKGSDQMPAAADPSAEPFCVENFTAAEIAWCQRESEPRLAFCGLWSAKKAAIKCGPPFAGLKFIDMEVLRDEQGRPRLRNSKASGVGSPQTLLIISHCGRTTAAMCLCRQAERASQGSQLRSLRAASAPTGPLASARPGLLAQVGILGEARWN
jgi:phosphopantetheinyl transferase (holo-ACP synthase)